METRNHKQIESDVYNVLITPSSMHFNYTLVVMLSAMLNCKKFCRFFIMQSDWTDEQKRTCEDFISEYPRNKVEFLNVDISVFSSFECFQIWNGSYASNFKLLAHNYLPDDVERILFLDTDTLVRKDIDSLYNVDFEDTFLSAAVHPDMREKHEEYAKKEEKGRCWPDYFTLGANMLNVKRFRENRITPEFYDEAVKNAGYKMMFAEQGTLNFLFWDKVKLYPFYYYNFYVGCYRQYREIKEIFNTTDAQERAATYHSVYTEDFDENKFATIVHITTHVLKPWQTVVKNGALVGSGTSLILGSEYNIAVEPFYLEWWETAKKLPQKCYEELVSNAREEYDQNCIRLFTRMTNVKTFFESLATDHYNGNSNFDNFILSIKGKKISILDNSSDAGRFFTKIAEQNGIDIVFKSYLASMTRLSDEEWEICKTADVIVSCYVHGGAVLERDNIKGILLSDVLKASHLLKP